MPTPQAKWPSKEEASKRTGIPVRTLERMVQRREIRQGYNRLPNRRAMAVLCPEDLDRIVLAEQARRSTALTLAGPQQVAPIPPAHPAEDAPAAPQPATQTAPMPSGEIVLRRAGRSRYVTLPEARDYIGLPVAYLEREIHAGRLPAIKSGAWFVRTSDLDRL